MIRTFVLKFAKALRDLTFFFFFGIGEGHGTI